MGSQLRHASSLARARRLGALLLGLLLGSCVNKDGEDLPEAQMAFPIAIQLSPDLNEDGEPKYAFVANSNFDLAYNVGSVQSYDLEVMVEAMDEVLQVCGCPEEDADPEDLVELCESILSDRCESDPDPVDCESEGLLAKRCELVGTDDCRVIPPDRCAIYPSQLDPGFDEDDRAREDVLAVPIKGLLLSEVRIGSFADGMSVVAEAAADGDGTRIYLPVRSDANLTFIDTNEAGELKCGEGFAGPDDFLLCEDDYRSGDLELVNPDDDISVPSDPVDVYAGTIEEDFPLPEGVEPDGDYSGQYVIMAHREGAASFFLDQDLEGDKRPRLVATIDELAPEQVTVTYQPGARIAWIASAVSGAITRVGISMGLDPKQTVLFDAGNLFMTGLDTGVDARDVAFDERSTNAERTYVLSRTPESILVTTRNPVGDELTFVPPQLPICSGPSRLRVELFELEGGEARLLGFVTCFDGRSVEIVDLDGARSITRSTNVSGAFEFVLDQARERMYLADFSTSTLRIFDLAPLKACLSPLSTGTDEECAPTLLGIVGIPQAVSELPR